MDQDVAENREYPYEHARLDAITPNLPPASASPNLTELLTLHILQQLQIQFASHNSAPQTGAPLLPTSSQPSAPPSPAKHHPVSIDEFCTFYSISQAGCKHLGKLDYQPGDAINKLERIDWNGEAGFAKLGWEHMLGTHCHFLKDV
jgi:hypothetical protein